MDFKKILGNRLSYQIPIENMVSLLKNEVRYKNGSCPVNEEIFINAVDSCIFKDIDSKIVIKENGIFFDIGIFNISLGSENSIIKTIDNLIDYYNKMADPKYMSSDSFIKYINNRLSIIKNIKEKVESMYKDNNRIEKIDEELIDENKLKLYIAYHDMENAKNSSFNSDKFLISIRRLSDFIKNNPELIESKAYFYYFDFEKEEMLNCKSTDMVDYVNECIKKNNGNEFTDKDIQDKVNLHEAYLVMEDLKVLDKSADYYENYVNILNEYIKDNIDLLMNDYRYSIKDKETGVSTEFEISEILLFVQKINQKNKVLVFKQ